MSAHYIDSHTTESLANTLSGAAVIGMDTEFMRERHYYPTLALLQLAVDDEIYLVDPLDYPHIDTLIAGFNQPGTTRIMHSAGQDIEVLNCHCDQPITGLFDTQIAASLLGIGDQISYAALVNELLGLEIPKSETRTNWLRRPLSTAQLDYAADDVRHLHILHEKLSTQLEQEGRLSWLTEESDALVARTSADLNADQLLRKVKGQQDMDSDSLAILRSFATWREQLAQKRNLPRGWLVADPTLVALASKKATDMESYLHVDDSASRVIAKEARTLAKLCEAALDLPDIEKPQLSSYQVLTGAEKSLMKKLRQALLKASEDNRVSAQLLCNRKDLEKLIRGGRDIPLMQGWRYEVAGQAVEREL